MEDLGWSFLEAREASAKALYERRICRHLGENWGHRTLRYLVYNERSTKRTHRLRGLRDSYGFHPIWLETASENKVSSKALREDICAVETGRWRASASSKPSLGVYQMEKVIRRCPLVL